MNRSQDAEDLAQDILFEAVKALKSGKAVVSFYSWYWAMAKNRFRMFLRMRECHAVELDAVEGTLVSDDDTELDLIKEQEISALNYSISRLSHLNREIIILFYLKEMKISEIATMLDVPEGTVKRRLYDAKTDIRKGINDMDNYGRSSYAPAELNLWGGYGIPDYWDKISDIMTKQIFVSCSKEAKNIRRIADEIGVAPVYFEEKLKYLLDNRFLKETSKGMYLTDFCIYPSRTWRDFWVELSDVYKSVGKEVTQAILSRENEIRALDFYGNDFPIGKLMWILYCEAANMMSRSMLEIYNGKWNGKIPDGNGKTYRISGQVTYPDDKFEEGNHETNSVGWSNIHYHFMTSSYSHIDYANLFQSEPFGDRDGIINDSNADLLMRIYDNPKLTLTPNEEEYAANLIRLDYLHKKDGGLYLSVPVMSYTCQSKLQQILRNAVSGLALSYVDRIAEAGERILLPEVRKDLTEEFVHCSMSVAFFPIGYLYYYGMNTSPAVLDIPEDYSSSSDAVCILYEK